MFSLFQPLKAFLVGPPSQREADDAYLSQSVDICDLERRMREIDQRGRGPVYGLSAGLFVQ